MAPIATSEALPNAASTTGVKPTPLDAISHGLTLSGIPSFDTLEDERQWMYGVLETP